MKKIILTSILASLLVIPILAGAAAPLPTNVTNLPDKSIEAILDTVANWLFTILLTISAIIIVIAGIMFVSSGGDPEKVTGARNLILYAVIGIIVAAMAKGLMAIVKAMVTQ